jgi:hypothetical protein
MRNIRKIIKHGNHIDLKRALDNGMIPDMNDLAKCHDSSRIKLLFLKNSFIIHSYVKKYVPSTPKLKLLIYYGAQPNYLIKYNDNDMLQSYYPEY